MKSLAEIEKIRNLRIKKVGDDGFMGFWTDPFTMRVFSVVFSWGGGWEHLSVNPIKNDRTPSWDEMCKFKEMFFRDDEACVEYHPKKEDYVNNMPHCLHIWRPIKETLPIPPSIFVGFVNKGEFK